MSSTASFQHQQQQQQTGFDFAERRSPGRPDLFSPGAAAQAHPEITSRGETVRAAVGDRVTLPCQVKNLGE